MSGDTAAKPDPGLGGAGLDKVIADTRRMLESARASSSGTGEEEALEGHGEARDGLVRVVARAPGEITELEVDPRLMRLPSPDLTESIMVAVNAALADLRTQALNNAPNPVGNLTTLSGQLEELHYESMRQLEKFTSAIGGAVEQFRTRRD